jgi:hypothetical protein
MDRYPILLSKAEAAEMTGLNKQYLDKLRKTNEVAVYVTKGGHHKFYRDSLIEHINKNIKNGTKR